MKTIAAAAAWLASARAYPGSQGDDPFRAWFSRVSEASSPTFPARSLSSITFDDVGAEAPGNDQARFSQYVNISGEPVLKGSPHLEENLNFVAEVGEAWRFRVPYEGDTFGLLKDKFGQPVYTYEHVTGEEHLVPHVSPYLGFSSILHKNGRTVLIANVDDLPGSTFLLDVEVDPHTGLLHLNRSTSMDWTGYGGLWRPSSGSLSPWNTHLGAEAEEPDARASTGNQGNPSCTPPACRREAQRQWVNMMRYHGMYPDEADMFAVNRETMDEVAHPYSFGYVFEAGLRKDGSYFVAKRLAMGRRAGESAFIMPDRRTAYMVDDGINAVLTVFVADTAKHLSAGRLLCARAQQIRSAHGGVFQLQWLDMGHADEDALLSALHQAQRPGFSDIFEAQAPIWSGEGELQGNAECAAGFKLVNTRHGVECLNLVPGQELLASRFETRRYAAYLGCTSEWNGMRGFTFSADTGKAYMSLTTVKSGMEDFRAFREPSSRFDAGTGNHVHVRRRDCGCLYELQLDASTYMATEMRGLLCGAMDTSSHQCKVNSIAGPGPLAAVHGHSALLIGEVTRRGHTNVLWKYDLVAGALEERIAALPTASGAEVASPYFYPDVAGWSYLTLVAQHPHFSKAAISYATWPKPCSGAFAYPAWSLPGGEGPCVDAAPELQSAPAAPGEIILP